MPNPYLCRTTITDPEDFYGRKEEIEDIYERIKSKEPQSVAVVSERKMGKSSLLYYIYLEKDKYLEDPEKYVFIFIDIQGETINSRDDFFKVLLRRLRENEKLGDRIVVDNKDNHENIEETVSKLDGNGYKLILFLDEFDLLVRKESIPPELYENLRALANRYAVAYITATVKSPTELTKEYGSPFFNIFTGETIGAFSKDEAMELIEVPSAREEVPLKNEAEFVFDISGLHPYFIQIACSILFKYKSKKEHLRKSDYDGIREKFLNESRFQFEHIWKHLSKKEEEVLLKLAKSKSIGVGEKYILADLRRKGYVIKRGKEYDIFSSVFKDFVAERKIKNVENPPENGKGIRRYAPIITMNALIAMLIGFIISIIKWCPSLSRPLEGMMYGLAVAAVLTSIGLVIRQIFYYIEIKYTDMIDNAYKRHPKNSQELYGELDKIRGKLKMEMSSAGAIGFLKRLVFEKGYERVEKKIDGCLSETRIDIMVINERFESLPTNLDAHIEKMLADKKVTKTEYDKFMDVLSKSDMKEEDKNELENVIGKWLEKE